MPTGTNPDGGGIVLLDTSTALALMIEDHEGHAQVLAALRRKQLGLADHAWFETYSVLTRLPGGLRRSPTDALRLLTHNFPATAFLGETAAAALGEQLAARGISGGAVYDALVGAAARQHAQRLISSDARARPTYEALGVDAQLIRTTGER
jgi:toxin FitB